MLVQQMFFWGVEGLLPELTQDNTHTYIYVYIYISIYIARCVLTSLSVDEMLWKQYVNWPTNFIGFPNWKWLHFVLNMCALFYLRSRRGQCFLLVAQGFAVGIRLELMYLQEVLLQYSDETDSTTFYDGLCTLVQPIPKYNVLIISVDVNAQIGKEKNNKLRLHNIPKRISKYLTDFTLEN